MNLTEIFILGFLIVLGLVAFAHSRKYSREIKKLMNKKFSGSKTNTFKNG
jgi:hypothetical protein